MRSTHRLDHRADARVGTVSATRLPLSAECNALLTMPIGNYGDTLLFPRFITSHAPSRRSAALARPQRAAELGFETVEKLRRAERTAYGFGGAVREKIGEIVRCHRNAVMPVSKTTLYFIQSARFLSRESILDLYFYKFGLNLFGSNTSLLENTTL